MMEQCLRIVDYSMFYIADLFKMQQANADFVPEESEELSEDESKSATMLAESVNSSVAYQSELVSLDIDSDDDKP